MLTLNKR